MSKPQDEVRNGFSLGVLIIGSLHWDPRCHREKWRRDRLDLSRRRYVRAPIRYGRLSKSGPWRDSYTMVFPSGLGADDHGHAIMVPYSQQVRNIEDVVDEAVHLWRAETCDGKNPKCRVSAENGWGCVGLLSNPQRPLPAGLRACWKKKISGETCYRRLNKADNEAAAAVDESGFLAIPWPKSEDGSALEVDILLATATCPTICKGSYPMPQKKSPKPGTTTMKASCTSTRTESMVLGPLRTTASRNICAHYSNYQSTLPLNTN